MTRTIEVSLEPVQSKLTKDTISVGDEVIYITMCTSTYHISRGKFLGTRVSKRTYTQSWGQRREVTSVDITYIVQQENGRKTHLQYARMVPASTPLAALVGGRL